MIERGQILQNLGGLVRNFGLKVNSNVKKKINRIDGIGFALKKLLYQICGVWIQFSSVAQLCPTLCNPMNRSTPGLLVHHQLPEFTQTHVH